MTNLLRFDFNDRDGIFEGVENGDWVHATDYDTLAAKLAKVEAERDGLRNEKIATLDRVMELTDMIEAEKAALAAMRSDALAFVLFIDENYRHAFGNIAREKIRAFFARIQTGETDE